MKTHRTLCLVCALILQGCAGAPTEPPKIERISAEQLEARLPQPAAALPLEQIVVLARQGIAAEEIISRISASGSRYRLSATRLVELAWQGVPLAVLDHLVAAERRNIFDEMAAEANVREKACQDRIALEVQACRMQNMPPLLFPGQHPFMHCFHAPPGSMFWRCF